MGNQRIVIEDRQLVVYDGPEGLDSGTGEAIITFEDMSIKDLVGLAIDDGVTRYRGKGGIIGTFRSSILEQWVINDLRQNLAHVGVSSLDVFKARMFDKQAERKRGSFYYGEILHAMYEARKNAPNLKLQPLPPEEYENKALLKLVSSADTARAALELSDGTHSAERELLTRIAIPYDVAQRFAKAIDDNFEPSGGDFEIVKVASSAYDEVFEILGSAEFPGSRGLGYDAVG